MTLTRPGTDARSRATSQTTSQATSLRPGDRVADNPVDPSAPASATSKIFASPLNAWYVAAWDHEVTSREPLARTVAGRPQALWRTADGRVSALADACWHRLAPLSKGKILGEELQCPY